MISRVARLVLFGACTIVLASSLGCTSFFNRKDSVDELAHAKPDASKTVRIQYDSPPSRLATMTAATGESLDAAGAVLAASETCRLSIVYPHPHGVPEMALATVAMLPEGFDGEDPSLWDRVSGEEGTARRSGQPLAAWTMDVPAWQIDGIVSKLRENNFFRRARPLGAEVYLAVQIDDVGFGKDYRAVPELDGLVVRSIRHGNHGGYAANSPAHSRPGPASQPQGAAQRGFLPIAAHLDDGRVHRLPPIH